MARRNDQPDLPFAQAEANAAEQANDLRSALAQVGCDLSLRVFVEMVHRAELNGAPLRKSYRELAGRPGGLCCSERTAQRTVAWAERERLVICTEHVDPATGQSANEYGIDWVGVGRILRREPRSASATRRAAVGRRETDSPAPAGPVNAAWRPPRQIDDGGRQIVTRGRQIVTPREDYLLNNSSHTSFTGTGTGSGTGRTDVVSERFGNVAELAASIHLEVDPLPIGWMAYGGAFSREHFFERHLRSTLAMVAWFRRQLSLIDPYTPLTSNRQADLILVIAAAERCLIAPQREVRVSRIAMFCNHVGHAQWHRFLSCIPAAADRLAQCVELLGKRGLNLNWPDGAIEQARAEQAAEVAR